MSYKFLFFNNSDLADTDSNGRTLRDVFSFIKDEDLFSFCIVRKNINIGKQNVFFIDEANIFKPSKFLKTIHSFPKNSIIDGNANAKKRAKKNPLTCLLRYLIWCNAFLFFRRKFKKWILSISPDYIIFDPSDFLFMHKIVCFASKVLKKPIIMYNTEDYYFKTWNYLHKENGFSFLYPLFRKKLTNTYKKSFKRTSICFHNVEGLKEIFKKEFPLVNHIVVYHPSKIISEFNDFVALDYRDFYYCGGLDKGRDETMVLLAKRIKSVFPTSRIYFNGRLNRSFNEEFVKQVGNVVNLGFCSYQEVENRLKQRLILISVASLNEYNAKDKYHVFSTKLSDYIASFNPIIHIGPEGEEYNNLKKYHLAFTCKSENEIDLMLNELNRCLKDANKSYFNNQRLFYEKYLSPQVSYFCIKNALGIKED